MKNITRKVTDFLYGAAIVPFMLGTVHGFTYTFEQDYLTDDYSFKNRLESAYCINVSESHKYYTKRLLPKGMAPNDAKRYKEIYMTNPWLTYPATIFLGLWAISMGNAAARIEEERRQKTR